MRMSSEPRAEGFEGFADGGPEEVGATLPGHVADVRGGAAAQDDLAAVSLGFYQDGIHADIGGDAGGEGLVVLGGTDFAAGDDAGVVGHVLGLEGSDLETGTSRNNEPGR